MEGWSLIALLEPWDEAVVVALGSNLKGDYPSREALLDAAVKRIADAVGPVRARSSWWENAAWPQGSGPDFLNGVIIVATAMEPRSLLEALHAIERDFGRERSERNAARTLDLDLIAYGRRVDPVGQPILPHPRAAERSFVMGPLAEIAPGWRHPLRMLTAVELAETASSGGKVERPRHTGVSSA